MEKLRQFDEFLTPFYVPTRLKSSVGTDYACEASTFLLEMITYKNFAPAIAERAFKELAKLECASASGKLGPISKFFFYAIF